MRDRSVLLIAAVAACGTETKLPPEQLQDPATCMECHPQHYTEWSGSMHALATDDPVFLAMNQRGQREAGIGLFCVRCHAPMAVALGTITEENAPTFDLRALPPSERGITCYFCHDVQSVEDNHNNGLVLALDSTMRGGVTNPTDSPAHFSKYDKELMRSKTNNSVMCGSCHDVVTPTGVALETTYQDWQTEAFAGTSPDPAAALPQTCSGCHMQTEQTEFIASKAGLDVLPRKNSFHLHAFPAIDQLPPPFPETDAQAAAIHEILDPSVTIVGPAKPGTNGEAPGGICLDPPGHLTVRMDTIQIGHSFPSGAWQDRRAWLEVVATAADGTVLFQTGVVPDNKDPEDLADPELVGFWDRTFKTDGTPAHFFWEVATQQPIVLKPPIMLGVDHSTTASFDLDPTTAASIDRITATLRIRAFNHAMLDDLVASGDLTADVLPQIPTLTSLAATKVWTRATAGMGAGSMFTNCNPNPAL